MDTPSAHTSFRKTKMSGAGERGGIVDTKVTLTARWLTVIEVAVVYALIIVQIWTFDGASLVPAGLALSLIVAGWIARKKSLQNLGFVDLRYVIPALAILFGKLAFGRCLQNHCTSGQIFLGIIGYFPWALFQESVLNSFFVDSFQALMKKTHIPWIAGLIFGIVHIPNPVLAPLAFLGGAAASYVFLRAKRRNVYLIALAHAVVAVAVFYLVPAPWHHHFAVGPRFWMLH